ncbi:hypothetical protein HZD82_22715, partial [Pantoea agglomerans]|uniref:hypothetical protein n=1 Tax=Enterobacter agglomerans TaxID=549 RepID=UPI001A8F2B34
MTKPSFAVKLGDYEKWTISGEGDAMLQEQAAANVQQTAATMNEMTATVKSNTETAHEANTLSAGTSH